MTERNAITLDRRTLLARASAAGLLIAGGPGLLAACGSDDDDSAATTGAIGGDLNLFVWEGYEMEDQFARWREQNDLSQNTLGFISTQSDVIAKLNSPSGRRVDATILNTSYAKGAYEQGLIRSVTTDEIPELDQLYPFFRDSPLFKISDGEYYNVPWTWGFTSITYRPDQVPAPKSYMDILDPKYAGRISTIDDSYNHVLLGAIAVGLNPDELTKDQLFGDVQDFMTEVVRNSKTIAASIGDQTNLLVSGEVDYMLVGLYLIDVFAKDNGATTKTAIPEEGVAGFTDCVAISAQAPNPDNAIAWAAQFITPEPKAGKAQDSIFGATTNPEIVPLISKPVRDLYPYDDIDGFLEKVVMPAGWPSEPEGDLATFDDTVKAWEDAKANA
jgi:spermidine/putrescine transport system substrate-binding protein